MSSFIWTHLKNYIVSIFLLRSYPTEGYNQGGMMQHAFSLAWLEAYYNFSEGELAWHDL
jgi:hypothetical protein